MTYYQAAVFTLILGLFSSAAAADPVLWRPYHKPDDVTHYKYLFHHCTSPAPHCPDPVKREVVCQNGARLFTRAGPDFESEFDGFQLFSFSFARQEGDLHYWRVQASGKRVSGPYGGDFTGHSIMILCF